MCLDYFITSLGSASAVEQTPIAERGDGSYEAAILVVWGKVREYSNLVLRGGGRALDSFHGFARAVAIGTGHFLHPKWFHPYSVGCGHRCSSN